MNFQIYQLAYRYEIVNCNHICMQDMTCDVMDWECTIFRGIDNASSLVSAIIGWIYYLIYIMYTLWWLHNALKEPYSVRLKMFKDAYMNCFYFLHIFNGAKNVTKTGDPFRNTFCNLNGYYCKNQQKRCKNLWQCVVVLSFYEGLEIRQWQQPASQWQKQRREALD